MMNTAKGSVMPHAHSRASTDPRNIAAGLVLAGLGLNLLWPLRQSKNEQTQTELTK